MKKLILVLITSVSMCVMPPIAPATDVSNNYSTMWLMQWLHNCSQALTPSYQMRGMTEHFAMQKAIFDCACVIDKFRANFTQAEADNMTVADRQLFSEGYTQECLGIILGT